MSNANEIGTKLVELCRQGKNQDAIRDLYSDAAVSVESFAMEGMPREMNGKEAINGKNQWWIDNHEVHAAEVQGPFPHGDDKFAVIFHFDVTNKPSGQRIKMNEIGVYEVSAGKVIREEFYYQGP